jgi:hypothetical protein
MPMRWNFWRQLAEKTTLTREDLRDEASIALTSGQTVTAEDAIKNLFTNDRTVIAADELLAAQLAIQKNLPEEAPPYLEKIFNDRRATDGEQLQAAMLQLGIAKKDDQNGQAKAWRL